VIFGGKRFGLEWKNGKGGPKRKPGWLARLFLRRVDAVTSRTARLADSPSASQTRRMNFVSQQQWLRRNSSTNAKAQTSDFSHDG